MLRECRCYAMLCLMLAFFPPPVRCDASVRHFFDSSFAIMLLFCTKRHVMLHVNDVIFTSITPFQMLFIFSTPGNFINCCSFICIRLVVSLCFQTHSHRNSMNRRWFCFEFDCKFVTHLTKSTLCRVRTKEKAQMNKACGVTQGTLDKS